MHRGGFLSPDRKVFVPKHIWVQKGAKFTAMQAKSECAESLVNEFRQVPPPAGSEGASGCRCTRAPRVQRRRAREPTSDGSTRPVLPTSRPTADPRGQRHGRYVQWTCGSHGSSRVNWSA